MRVHLDDSEQVGTGLELLDATGWLQVAKRRVAHLRLWWGSGALG